MKPTQLFATAAKVACSAVVLASLFGAQADAQAPAGSANKTLRVWAPEALRGALQEIGYEFERQHPNLHITYEFAPSGVLYAGTVQGVPSDILILAGDGYQNKLTDGGFVNLYHTVAYDHIAAVARCGDAQALAGKLDAAYLRSMQGQVVMPNEDLSPLGGQSMHLFDGLTRSDPKLEAGMARVLGTDQVADALKHGGKRLGMMYASQTTQYKTQGLCLRSVALASGSYARVAFTVSVLNSVKFHFVGPRRKADNDELAAFYRSKYALGVWRQWGLQTAK